MHIRLEQITKQLKHYQTMSTILQPISLVVPFGSFLAITGASGSGKSTLLALLGCLDTPSSGTYFLDNEDISVMDDGALAQIRNRKIGFIFQRFCLIPHLNACDNVMLPGIYALRKQEILEEEALTLLSKVGLANHANHYPHQLSGGQQQRVAIARALINRPTILLADELTGSLDSCASRQIMDIIHALHQSQNCTIIIVTHDQNIAQQAPQEIILQDGAIRTRRGL